MDYNILYYNIYVYKKIITRAVIIHMKYTCE